MSKEAPAVKKLLEEFIFRMKSLVQSNDCLGAISVGNLKNRSLDGELLVAPVEESEDEEPPGSNEGNENSDSDSSDSDPGRAGKRRVQADDGDNPEEEEDEEEEEE
ncbi:unnamed protein product, partial [Ectocarpus sp. 12 AP-2014]